MTPQPGSGRYTDEYGELKITRYPDDFTEYRYSLKVDFTGRDHAPDGRDLVVVMFNPATVQEDVDLWETALRP